MTAVENGSLNRNFQSQLKEVVCSHRAQIITLVALTITSALFLALSAWANVKVATTLYGTTQLIKQCTSILMIPISATCLTGTVLLLFLCRKSQRSPLPAPKTQEVLSQTSISESFLMIAPLPGRCLSLKCQMGQTVQKGELLCEIECMKMSNSIRANESGTIVELYVKEGDILKNGQAILRIESFSDKILTALKE